MPEFVGAILTGGLSSRMGFDKALAVVGDAPMITHVATRPARRRRVRVVERRRIARCGTRLRCTPCP